MNISTNFGTNILWRKLTHKRFNSGLNGIFAKEQALVNSCGLMQY